MLITAAKDMKDVDAVILAVAHREYVKWGLEKIASLCRKNRAILLDIKSVFNPAQAKSLGIEYWRL
jgi:UDP-N-acetyl-D-galactosamine dehydrogenase